MQVDDSPGIAMTRIGIIADDLTGACDTALQFFNVGFHAVVALAPTGILAAEADAIAVSTNSRHCEPDEAYSHVAGAVQRMRAAGIDTFYKKIDSALRGNIGSELDALANASGARAVVVAPSFPAHHRTVEQGKLLIKGQPLTDTPLLREHALETCAVVEIISRTTASAIQSIPLDVIRAGTEHLEAHLLAAVTAGFQILVCDAVTNGDLEAIACVVGRHTEWQSAGSAGLAAALAQLRDGIPAREKRPVARPPMGRRLVVVGSQHPAARAQLECLQETRGVPVIYLSPDALRLNRTEEIERSAQELNSFLKAGTDVALTFAPSDLFTQDTKTARSLARAMGEILSRLVPAPRGLVIAGGNTAMGILEVLETESAEIIAEVEPGIPALRLHGGRYADATVITKAGSFGNRDTLACAYAFLENELS